MIKKIYLLCGVFSFFNSVIFSQTFPAGFSTTEIGFGWVNPTGAVFNKDGQKLFVWEKSGHVYVCNRNGSGTYIKQVTPVLDIEDEVGDWGDFGLLGFALDPNFATNGYIYLMYVVDRHHLLYYGTPNYDPATNEYFNATIGRIARYQTSTVAGNLIANPASRTILLGETKQTGIPITFLSHGTGALEFAADGTLLASTGDGASYDGADSGSNSGSYYAQALADGILRSEENVGAFRAQMLNSLNGKLLRINPANGDGIPSNPFYDPAAPHSVKSRVWALGFRNPFRFTIKPGTGSTNPATGDIGEIYVGDVGWSIWEELDIINAAGVNCGWPLYEGLQETAIYYDYDIQNRDEPNPLYNGGSCNRPYFTFKELLKQATADNIKTIYNPCNNAVAIGTGNRYFHHRPSIDWSHYYDLARVGIFNGNNATEATVGTIESGVEGSPFKGSTSIAGCWYTGTAYPVNYRNTFFQADFVAGWLKNFNVDFIDKIQKVQDFASGFAAIVSMTENPIDGTLLYVDYWFGFVKNINYGGNQLPQAVITSDKTFGPSTLTVSFNSSGSFDQDGTIATRLWDFGDGSPTSSNINPTHNFTAPPATPTKYVVKFTVTDNSGGTSVDSIIISVNNTPPVVNITSPVKNSLYTPGSDTTYTCSAIVTDAEHTPGELKYAWQTILRHNAHQHSEPIDTNRNTTSTISRLNCNGDTYYWEFRLTVTDPAGLSTTDSSFIYPTVTPSVSIAATPGNSICSGTSVIFTATSTNGGSIPFYQWKLNGNSVGTNSNQYQSTSLMNGDIVTCTLTSNADCASPTMVTSNPIIMTVNTLLTPSVSIAAIPGNTICPGTSVTFTATPTNGGPSPSYQWKLNGNNVGTNSNQYTNTSLANGDIVACIFTSNYVCVSTSFANSNTITITINAVPSISVQPVSQSATAGSGVSFTVTATGNGLTYQWRKGGINIPSATNNTYSISNIAIADAGNYDVVVSGICSQAVTSNVANLKVSTIVTQPTNQSVCSGANASFNIVAASSDLISYQWQISINGNLFTDITGATSPILNLNAVTIGSSGNKYRCVINNTLVSNAGVLTVNPFPTVTLTLPFDTLYQNSPIQILSGGSPTGGTYACIGSNSGSFDPASNQQGNYSVTYKFTDASGCSSTANDVFTIIAQDLEVNLYPNPSLRGELNIVASPNLVGSNVTAYSSFGQKMSNWKIGGRLTTYRFNWPTGIYILLFSQGTIKISKKVVVIR